MVFIDDGTGKFNATVPVNKTTNSKIPPFTQIKTWVDGEVKEATPTPNAGEHMRFVFNTTGTGIFLLKDQGPTEYFTIKQLLSKKDYTATRIYNHEMGEAGSAKLVPKKTSVVFVPSKADEALYDKCFKAMATSTKIINT